MLLQWSAPEYMPHSFQVSGLSGTVDVYKRQSQLLLLIRGKQGKQFFAYLSARIL